MRQPGGSSGAGYDDKEEFVYKFQMPKAPVNPLNMTLGDIGTLIIKSNVNIAEEFKKKVGNFTDKNMHLVKISDQNIIDTFKNCNIQLNNDEYVNLNAFIIQKKDSAGLILLIDFLSAIGLPAQQTSLSKQLPKRILNESELKQAADIIKGLRNQL